MTTTRPAQQGADTVLRTRAGREITVGHAPGNRETGAEGRVVLEVVETLDERGGVLCAGLIPEEARRLAYSLLAQAAAAELPRDRLPLTIADDRVA